MLVLRATPTIVRRNLARHPWLYWSGVAFALLMLGTTVAERAASVDAARERWEATSRVWVASVDHVAGDPLEVEPVMWPTAMVADTAAIDIEGLVARQQISAGEVVDRRDLMAHGPRGLIPDGWVALAIVESPRLGVRVGARVQLVSDGLALHDHGVVIDSDDQRTIVAVEADAAPTIALAAANRAITMLLLP